MKINFKKNHWKYLISMRDFGGSSKFNYLHVKQSFLINAFDKKCIENWTLNHEDQAPTAYNVDSRKAYQTK